MIQGQIGIERAGMRIRSQDEIKPLRQSRIVVWWTALVVATLATALVPRRALAQVKKPPLPYATIDHPQFIVVSQANFLAPKDLLIGVRDGKSAKAYPAAILAQHGVVQDQMADGPIAVTW